MDHSFRFLFVAGLLAIGHSGLFTALTPAAAQYPSAEERRDNSRLQPIRRQLSPSQEQPGSASRSRDVGSVADWAAPAFESSRKAPSSQSARSASRSATGNPPDFPDDPQKAPVGPTGWLVTIGLGYGIFRLRDSE